MSNMATFRSLCCVRQAFRPYIQRRAVRTSAVLSNWNKDWKPAPFPVTPEERAAAAKKYGMRVEDYDVYPDDGTGHGDYPMLPYVSGDSRSANEDWDLPEIRRNYGEPLHVQYDMIGEDRWNPNYAPRVPLRKMWLVTGTFFAVFISLYLLLEPYPHFQAKMPKEYPFNNLYIEKGGDPSAVPTIKHYTFEPAD